MDLSWIKDDLAFGAGASNLTFNEKIKSLRAQGEVVSHLGFGQCPFPLPKSAIEEAQKHAWRSTYAPIRGIKPLREEIIRFHEKLDNIMHFSESDVICAPGSKELIYLAMNTLTTKVIICTPAWPSYKPQALMANKNPICIKRHFDDDWKLQAKQLDVRLSEEKIPPKSLLIFTNPDNPTGCTYNEEELIHLSDVCRKHDLIVLSDEIYNQTGFDNFQSISISKFYKEGTIVCSGISKWCGGGGWRLGYFLVPKELNVFLKALVRAAGQTYATVSEPIQWATIKLMEFGPEIQSYNKHFRRIMGALSNFTYKSLTNVGVDVKPTNAGFYLFVNFEKCRAKLEKLGVKTGQDFCDLLFEEKRVALMPGGPSFLQPIEELSTRLCYVDFNGAHAMKCSEEIGLDSELPATFIQDSVPEMYVAITKLCDFVRQYS